MSPLWPYNVSTMVTLDDTPPVVLDLVDHTRPDVGGNGPETVQSEVVWSATGLNHTQHTLVISVANQHRFAIVDGFLYVEAKPTYSVALILVSGIPLRIQILLPTPPLRQHLPFYPPLMSQSRPERRSLQTKRRARQQHLVVRSLVES